MATQTTEPSERDDTERPSTQPAAEESTGRALPSTVIGQVKNGRLPMLVGGVMAVRGVRDLLSDGGGGLGQTAAGLVLLGVGLRQRSKAGIDSQSAAMKDTEDSLPGSETVSRRSEANVPGHNPRDVDDEPDVATAEAPDEGAVRYETERDDVDVERKPHLEETDPKDPRYPDEGDPETDDGHVDVDVSESALADEPNEAVGPDEEQAFPASEGTDPEPTSPEAPEWSGEGDVADSDADADESVGDEEDGTGNDASAGDEEEASDETAEDAGDDEATGDEETATDESEDDSESDVEESI